MQSIDAILGGLRQLTTPYPTSFLAQPHEPHASLAAEERQAAPGLLRAGAVEIGNADVVALDDHAQPAAVGFSAFVTGGGSALDWPAQRDPPRPDGRSSDGRDGKDCGSTDYYW